MTVLLRMVDWILRETRNRVRRRVLVHQGFDGIFARSGFDGTGMECDHCQCPGVIIAHGRVLCVHCAGFHSVEHYRSAVAFHQAASTMPVAEDNV